MWRSDRRVRDDVSNGGSCGGQTEESGMMLAMRDCVEVRQKSQE